MLVSEFLLSAEIDYALAVSVLQGLYFDVAGLEHFATYSAPTGQNGVAAFSQLTQQQQQQQQISLKNDPAIHVLTHNNGLPSLNKNENGITGA